MKANVFVAELLGTFIVCFASIGAYVGASGSGLPVLLCAAFAYGLSIVVAGIAVGHVSGGHFNPAISASMLVSGKMNMGSMLAYWGAQLFGAAIAAGIVKLAFPASWVNNAALGIPALNSGISPGAAFTLELISLYVVTLVLMGANVFKRTSKIDAVYCGIAMTAMVLAVGSLTGVGLNPARWFGPALVTGTWGDFLPYFTGPLVGAILGAMTHAALFTDRDSSTD